MFDFCPGCGVFLGYRSIHHPDCTWKAQEDSKVEICPCSNPGTTHDVSLHERGK